MLDVKKIRKELNLTQGALANKIGVNIRTVQKWESGETKMSGSAVLSLQNLENELYGVSKNVSNCKVKEIDSVKKSKNNNKKIEAKQLPFEDFMEVPYLPAIAHAGYLAGMEDNTYEELDTILVPKEFEKGNYLAIEVSGDSMDDGTTRAICNGDKLMVKEIENFQGRLPFRHKLFVIVGWDGVVCKQIIAHDLEKENITCRSFNKFYEDYIIRQSEIYKLFEVKKIIERKIKL